MRHANDMLGLEIWGPRAPKKIVNMKGSFHGMCQTGLPTVAFNLTGIPTIKGCKAWRSMGSDDAQLLQEDFYPYAQRLQLDSRTR